MSFSVAELEAQLDAIKLAYASGVTEVRYDGKVTVYDSGAAMLARIRYLEAEIARVTTGKKAPIVGLASFRRG